MFNKTKIIASVLAATAAMTAVSAAASAEVIYESYDYGTDTISTVSYDSYDYNDNDVIYESYEKVPTVVYDYIDTTYDPGVYTISYDSYGNKIYTYADGTVYYEKQKTKKNDTSDFAKVIYDNSDYYTEYATKASAERAVGLKIKTPDDQLDDFPFEEYTVISGSILQVRYFDGYGSEVTIRKALGKCDLSGDDYAYNVTKKETLNKAAVILYGSKDQGYFKAIAYKNGYSYSVESAYGMSKSDMESIVKAMVK